MGFLKILLKIFLFPGDLVINKIGISPEQDGGIIRSSVNMVFWSVVALAIALPTLIF